MIDVCTRENIFTGLENSKQDLERTNAYQYEITTLQYYEKGKYVGLTDQNHRSFRLVNYSRIPSG